jgi:hypothetical protein
VIRHRALSHLHDCIEGGIGDEHLPFVRETHRALGRRAG